MNTYPYDLFGLPLHVWGTYTPGTILREDEPGSEPVFEICDVYLKDIDMTPTLANLYTRNGTRLLEDMEQEMAYAIERKILAG
jgi:hypothetical protein